MEFIDIPTEQTTAVTDLILAIIAIVSAMYMPRISKNNQLKTVLWVCLFSLIAVASALGTIVHGFKLSNMLKTFLWHPLNLSLGFVVAIFISAVVCDVWGEKFTRRILPLMLFIGAGFFCITMIWPDSFLVFIIYEAAGMFFALGGYVSLAYRNHLKGAWMMAIGILVTIVAAAIQAGSSFIINFIWLFDNNGTYHIVQMVGILFLVTGLKKMKHWNPSKS